MPEPVFIFSVGKPAPVLFTLLVNVTTMRFQILDITVLCIDLLLGLSCFL